jgi:hypothetical protein
MKKMIAVLLPVALLIPAIAAAESSFDGTWKVRVSSMQFSGTPDNFSIKDGTYSCGNCVPPFTIKADGTDQPTPMHNTRDHAAVKVLSPMSFEETDKVKGKTTLTQTTTVSADGAKLTVKFTDYTGAKPVTSTVTEKRVAPAPAGAHAASGSWMADSVPELSEAGQSVTYASTPNGLKMTANGRVTDAKFDGKAYPTQNDPGHTLVTIKKISDRQIEERDQREGKVYDIIVSMVSADGKTMTVVDEDPVHGTKVSMTLDKQ